ncbi:rRNA maturation RNase YbeY [Paraglaciecola aquimarina]|uniref:Endoribonuclease YbeY n=1 Tax=Paraglaciecola aquimarina TaxID=1235557 RepID=A0ABU3SXZ8_9ALTE|nr:rRNA maturation RNase YbeY [Paraglaciecola aquimarina]MDU0354873.1 rRNA maturation RNase YbeY [Paraglaciecola aquimarina]
MTAILDLQIASTGDNIPSQADFQLWTDTVLTHLNLTEREMTIRVVDEDEIQQLNHQYRGKDKTTNVLSFPFEQPALFLPAGITLDPASISDEMPNLLGDLVVCTQVVATEAEQQNKIISHHWAHMIIHGTLHLLGYDHIEDDEADIMESLEITLLHKLAIDDPYQDH